MIPYFSFHKCEYYYTFCNKNVRPQGKLGKLMVYIWMELAVFQLEPALPAPRMYYMEDNTFRDNKLWLYNHFSHHNTYTIHFYRRSRRVVGTGGIDKLRLE